MLPLSMIIKLSHRSTKRTPVLKLSATSLSAHAGSSSQLRINPTVWVTADHCPTTSHFVLFLILDTEHDRAETRLSGVAKVASS